MGGPASMSNSSMRIECLGEVWLGFGDKFLQLFDLADLLEGKDLVLLVAVDGETSRVITTIFETREAYPRI